MRYEPHEYQKYAVDYIETHPAAAIFLDCGLGKTSITLTAIADLLFDSFEIHKVLVIAPLRVARDTWTSEADKWDHLQNLICSVAVGTEAQRRAALMRRADIYIINRENIQWLIDESGIPFDFDMVVIDELSSFKNHQTKRFKSLLKVRPKVNRIVGLTGTPASNGLMDLWAEFRILDMGQRLGRFITKYRTDYFTPDKRNGQIIYSYKPLPYAEDAIYRQISDITISMKSADHLQMPELVSSEYTVQLSEDEREKYTDLKQELVLSLGDLRGCRLGRRLFYCHFWRLGLRSGDTSRLYGNRLFHRHYHRHDEKIETHRKRRTFFQSRLVRSGEKGLHLDADRRCSSDGYSAEYQLHPRCSLHQLLPE